jgi:hypothetical protein
MVARSKNNLVNVNFQHFEQSVEFIIKLNYKV